MYSGDLRVLAIHGYRKTLPASELVLFSHWVRLAGGPLSPCSALKARATQCSLSKRTSARERRWDLQRTKRHCGDTGSARNRQKFVTDLR
jgi:hypothetical protein